MTNLNKKFTYQKNHAEKLANNHKDNVEVASNIVLKELDRRNMTILKTKTVKQPPKTPAVINTIAMVEEMKDVKNDSPAKRIVQ